MTHKILGNKRNELGRIEEFLRYLSHSAVVIYGPRRLMMGPPVVVCLLSMKNDNQHVEGDAEHSCWEGISGEVPKL